MKIHKIIPEIIILILLFINMKMVTTASNMIDTLVLTVFILFIIIVTSLVRRLSNADSR